MLDTEMGRSGRPLILNLVNEGFCALVAVCVRGDDTLKTLRVSNGFDSSRIIAHQVVVELNATRLLFINYDVSYL